MFEEYKSILDKMIDDNVVMASDLSRILILYDQGGVYLDFDQVLYEYDGRLNSFDFISYTTDEFAFGYLIAETSFIGSKPKHPLLIEFMNQTRAYIEGELIENSAANRSFMR